MSLRNNFYLNSFEAPITKKEDINIIQLNPNYLQIYKIKNFISSSESKKLIEAINQTKLVRTGKANTFNEYTDKKCDLNNHQLVKDINSRMSLLIGCENSLPTLGMKYYQKDYKNKHFDNPWKTIDGKSILASDALKNKSKTTWTFMVYINDIDDGGETYFPRLNIKVIPKMGSALVWNNLFIDGSLNPFSEHQSLSVKSSEKYILTKWFRSS